MADLQISPSELKFRFELRKTIPVTLTLTNPGQEKVAFKVKTTSPKKYCVRPSSGVVEPGSSKDVQVIMQAQREYPPDPYAQERSRLRADLQKAQKDKADMTKRLELLELQGQGGSRSRPQQAAAGFSTWIVLLIAVLSFLVGKYLAGSVGPKGLSSAVATVNDTVAGELR